MKLVDISHVLDSDTPVYPGDSETDLFKYRCVEIDGYTGYQLHTSLHTGTHIDVPMHLLEDGRTVADFPPEAFTGRGLLLDVRGRQTIPMDPQYHRLDFSGAVVLLQTGFDRYYGQDRYFSAHPVVGPELARFLLSQPIKMLGLDMPSPDRAPFAFHKALLAKGVFLLENLRGLEALSGAGPFRVMALPLKLRAEASPVRAVCLAE